MSSRPWLQGGNDKIGETSRFTHGVSRGLQGIEGWSARVRVRWRGAADDAEVVQNRIVPAEKRLPGPQRRALERRIVVGVGDHHLPSVVRRRIQQPPAVTRYRAIVEPG